jgi:hypothetical protein
VVFSWLLAQQLATHWISRILLKGDRKGVCTVNSPFGNHTQQDADNALSSSSSDTMIVIGAAQQNQGMHCYIFNVSEFRGFHHRFFFITCHGRHILRLFDNADTVNANGI